MLLRHHVKAFTRETIAFSKTHNAMVLKYAIFAAWKNYMRPQFTKVQKRNPLANQQSPAMALGLADKLMGVEDFFEQRKTPQQVQLCAEWRLFLKNEVPYLRSAA
jgi:hypothetical protein